MSADTQSILSTHFIYSYDFDPNADTVTDVGWVDCRPYKNFCFQFFRTVGTGNLDTFRVIGNTATNGGGTDVTVKTKTISSEPNAVGDFVFIEVSAEEINAAGVAAGVEVIGISAACEFATSTDEGVVTYIFTGPRHAYLNLTADHIS